jgi:FkbM family methyltransferase
MESNTNFECYFCNNKFNKRNYYHNHLIQNHKMNIKLKTLLFKIENYKKVINDEQNRRINKIISKLKKCKIIFDIGSGNGSFTEKLLSRKNGLICHLFEPINNLSEISLKKFSNNKNILINNFGLSNYNEKKYIFRSISPKEFGLNTYLDNINLKNYIKESTILSTLDQYCKYNKIDKIDFVKINTDGYEANVIDGFFRTLRSLKNKPYILIKLKWGSKHPNWQYCKNIFVKLLKIGYYETSFDRVKDNSYVLFEPINNL